MNTLNLVPNLALALMKRAGAAITLVASMAFATVCLLYTSDAADE